METVIAIINGRYEILEYDHDSDTYYDTRTGIRITGPVILVPDEVSA